MSSRRILLPHQLTLLRAAKHKRILPLWAKMRLGKSLVAKRWADSRPNNTKRLIVSPLAAISSWRRELISDGVDSASIVELVGTKQHRLTALEALPNAVWHLLNWEALAERDGTSKKAKPTPWVLLPWSCVILDESPKIKNAKSKTTRVALEHLTGAKYRACLSGLPNPESPEDYVCQMIFLFGEFMGCTDFWQWRSQYMQPSGHTWVPKRYTLGSLKTEVQTKSVMMLKSPVGSGSKLQNTIRAVELPARIMKAIAHVQKHMELGSRMTSTALTAMLWVSQLAGGRYPEDDSMHHDAKLNDMLELLTSTDLVSEQVIVSAQYTAELYAAVETLASKGISASFVTGASRKDSKRKYTKFRIQDELAKWKVGKTRILVCQPKILQMGVDLSMASTTIHLSRWWSYETNAQFDERTNHPTKKEPRLSIDIVARGTVDEDKADALADKGANAAAINSRFLQLAKDRLAGS